MGMRLWRTLFITICIICFAAVGTSFGQAKKVGGGDIKYEGKGSDGPVLFSHETHVNAAKLKCTECHTKIFKMKKEAKITKADHSGDKLCAACHNGKKAFSASAEGECAKCHKK